MGAGLSSTGTEMELAGFGGMWGNFLGVENGGDQSCSWGRRPSSSFPGLSVRLGLAWGQSQEGWARGDGLTCVICWLVSRVPRGDPAVVAGVPL